MKNKIKNFCIIGERNSGTNFLHTSIEKNFNLTFNKIHGKHFWNKEKNLELHSDTAIIVIIRNVINWINSMYHSPFHLQPELKNPKNKLDFLNKKFWSFYDNAEKNGKMFGKEILADRHLDTKERYKNIFEARYVKYNYLFELSESKNDHIFFLKYEDLNEEYEKTMKHIAEYYDITFKNSEIQSVDSYRGYETSKKMSEIKPKPKIFSEEEITSHKDFDLMMETKFGYKFGE